MMLKTKERDQKQKDLRDLQEELGEVRPPTPLKSEPVKEASATK